MESQHDSWLESQHDPWLDSQQAPCLDSQQATWLNLHQDTWSDSQQTQFVGFTSGSKVGFTTGSFHSGPEVAKNGQNYLKDFFRHEIHQNRGFWGQEFQKCNQNFHTLSQVLCTCKKIAKMCAKYMLYIDLYVFGAKDFKNATIIIFLIEIYP